MGSETGSSMTGEKIYEYDLDITGVTDYGLSMDAILSGSVPLPPQGLALTWPSREAAVAV